MAQGACPVTFGAVALVQRTRTTDAGVKYDTIEVPLTVWCASLTTVQRHFERWRRGRERAGRKAQGLKLVRDGWKSDAIAHELGVSARAVQKWAADEARARAGRARAAAKGVTHTTIMRLASRPEGATNRDVAAALNLDPDMAGSRLARKVRTGSLVKRKIAGQITRFFTSAALADAWVVTQQETTV